jgi:hypothetical protein
MYRRTDLDITNKNTILGPNSNLEHVPIQYIRLELETHLHPQLNNQPVLQKTRATPLFYTNSSMTTRNWQWQPKSVR